MKKTVCIKFASDLWQVSGFPRTNKTDHHNITKILLKVALSTWWGVLNTCDCSLYWYWWNCWPSVLKHSYYNVYANVCQYSRQVRGFLFFSTTNKTDCRYINLVFKYGSVIYISTKLTCVWNPCSHLYQYHSRALKHKNVLIIMTF